MNSTERDLAKRAATAARIMLEYEAWEMPAPPPADPLDYAWTAQVITDQADALASIRAELAEALADKARVDELLTAAVDDYDAAREVLKPFSALAQLIKDDVPDDTPVVNILGENPLTAGHFRRARAIAGEQTNDA